MGDEGVIHLCAATGSLMSLATMKGMHLWMVMTAIQ
jgi:hypothetical protein